MKKLYIAIVIILVFSLSTILFIRNLDDSTEMTVDIDSSVFTKFVDTAQDKCYDASSQINCPSEGQSFFGQDAQYESNYPSYQDNGDSTITDLNTGLMWQQDPGGKVSYEDAIDGIVNLSFAGYNDWRVPTIKELYSLMDFRGVDPDSADTDITGLVPFIDTDYFDFSYGDTSNNERIIDSQWVTSNIYEATVMDGQECFFGVNFADGRIKCYPTVSLRNQGYFVIYVRGNSYGINGFVDNNDGTITDNSTGYMWQQDDSVKGFNWDEALAYCTDLTIANHLDWRLPNAKELQYIVDYTKSPDTTDSATMDSIFGISEITNELGQKDYPFFWTSTTHISHVGAESAAYISFGRALGYMDGVWMDVHGAGAQRSDPKAGGINDFPEGRGPQGDAIRVYNYVRCIRGGANVVEVQSEEIQFDAPQLQGDQQASTQGDPPPEAITACNNGTEGDSCSFAVPNGTVSGSCKNIESVLACVP